MNIECHSSTFFDANNKVLAAYSDKKKKKQIKNKSVRNEQLITYRLEL